MARYKNVPPPEDFGGWSADALYYPPDDPLQGGVRPGTFFARLTDPRLYGQAVPERAPPGQFLPFMFEGLARMPRPAPPGQFLASIGLPPGRPDRTVAARPALPPPPASVPDQVSYAELTNPTPTTVPRLGEQIADFGRTAQQLPSRFVPIRPTPQPIEEGVASRAAPPLQGADFATLADPKPTIPPEASHRNPGFGTVSPPLPGDMGPAMDPGDGLGRNAAAGFEQGASDIAGTVSDDLAGTINRTIDGINTTFETDYPEVDGLPLGSRWITQNAESTFGIPDPANIRATTPGQRVARTAGEAAAYLAALRLSPITARLAIERMRQIDPERAIGLVKDLIALGESGFHWLLGEPDPPASNPAWQSLGSLDTAGGALAGGLAGPSPTTQWLTSDGRARGDRNAALAGGLIAPDVPQALEASEETNPDGSQHFGGYSAKIADGGAQTPAPTGGKGKRASALAEEQDAAAFALALEELKRYYRPGTRAPHRDVIPNGPGVDLRLYYRPAWTAEQRADADRKVAILDSANTIARQTAPRDRRVIWQYKKEFGNPRKGKDIDHTVDIQLNGGDTVKDLHELDSSVNRSIGAQIQNRIKNLKPGTIILRITIGDR